MVERRVTPWGSKAWGPIVSHPLHGLQQQLNQAIEGYWRSLGSPTARPASGVSFAPQLDVAEDAAAVTVSIELPGVSKGELEVAFANGILSIRGEKRVEAGQEDRHYALRECEFGRFERAIAIGPDVDAEAIEANYSRGILRVVLPKTEEVKSAVRRIPIEGR
jgi:HSP20 family protein